MPDNAIKLLDLEKGLIEGLAIPFGGPFDGKDFDGEFFSKDTDFLLGDYENRPVRFLHGKDAAIQYSKVGTQTAVKQTDAGMWITAQLDKADEYGKMVMELLRASKDANTPLYFSSGAQDSAILVDPRTGAIKRWPWVETSIVPMAANPYAVIAAKAARVPVAELRRNVGKAEFTDDMLERFGRVETTMSEVRSDIYDLRQAVDPSYKAAPQDEPSGGDGLDLEALKQENKRIMGGYQWR